jgi:hypothetical protein
MVAVPLKGIVEETILLKHGKKNTRHSTKRGRRNTKIGEKLIQQSASNFKCEMSRKK